MLSRFVAACVIIVGSVSSASAALIITVGDLKIDPGKTGSVDVTIRSTTGTDLLDIFGAVLQINGPGLTFVNPPGDTQLADLNYIFNGDSLGLGGVILSNANPDDTYFGGDGTVSMAGVLVPTTDSLLLRLDVMASASTKPGDTFTISLQTGDPDTFFVDPNFAPIDFSTTAGTVTITPEPTSIFVLGMTMSGLAVVWRKRQRKAG